MRGRLADVDRDHVDLGVGPCEPLDEGDRLLARLAPGGPEVQVCQATFLAVDGKPCRHRLVTRALTGGAGTMLLAASCGATKNAKSAIEDDQDREDVEAARDPTTSGRHARRRFAPYRNAHPMCDAQ